MKKSKKLKHSKYKIKTKKKFKNLNCSPSLDKQSFSCFSKDDLMNLKKLWNHKFPQIAITTNDPKIIWRMLKFYLKRKCDKESCWVKELSTNKFELNHLLDSFSPKCPLKWKKNPREWLSSVEIIQVMQQYEKAYRCFKFIGPSPIDFDDSKAYGSCVWEDLCKFDLNKHISNKKHKLGIIFNTDPHYKDGEHWISLFINCKKKFIYFFDSVGHKCPKRIETLVNKIINQGKECNPKIDFKFDQNYPIEHQKKNTECGIYSLFFITHMLRDHISKDYLKTKILPDDYIYKFRKIFFNDDL
jgi:hypothetical protein